MLSQKDLMLSQDLGFDQCTIPARRRRDIFYKQRSDIRHHNYINGKTYFLTGSTNENKKNLFLHSKRTSTFIIFTEEKAIKIFKRYR